MTGVRAFLKQWLFSPWESVVQKIPNYFLAPFGPVTFGILSPLLMLLWRQYIFPYRWTTMQCSSFLVCVCISSVCMNITVFVCLDEIECAMFFVVQSFFTVVEKLCIIYWITVATDDWNDISMAYLSNSSRAVPSSQPANFITLFSFFESAALMLLPLQTPAKKTSKNLHHWRTCAFSTSRFCSVPSQNPSVFHLLSSLLFRWTPRYV